MTEKCTESEMSQRIYSEEENNDAAAGFPGAKMQRKLVHFVFGRPSWSGIPGRDNLRNESLLGFPGLAQPRLRV